MDFLLASGHYYSVSRWKYAYFNLCTYAFAFLRGAQQKFRYGTMHMLSVSLSSEFELLQVQCAC